MYLQPSSCLSDKEEDEIYGFGYGVFAPRVARGIVQPMPNSQPNQQQQQQHHHQQQQQQQHLQQQQQQPNQQQQQHSTNNVVPAGAGQQRYIIYL